MQRIFQHLTSVLINLTVAYFKALYNVGHQLTKSDYDVGSNISDFVEYKLIHLKMQVHTFVLLFIDSQERITAKRARGSFHRSPFVNQTMDRIRWNTVGRRNKGTYSRIRQP